MEPSNLRDLVLGLCLPDDGNTEGRTKRSRGRPKIGDGFDKKAYDRQYAKDRRDRLRAESDGATTPKPSDPRPKHKTKWIVTAPERKG